MDGLGPPETLAHAVDRLQHDGYDLDFVAERDGLRVRTTGALFAPEDLIVDEIVRFEGLTDPGDEAIICALRDSAGTVRGTFAAAYGPTVATDEAAMLRRLPATG